MSIIYPGFFVIWAAAFTLFVWHKIPFDRKLFAGWLRLDILLCCAMVVCWLLWLLPRVPRLYLVNNRYNSNEEYEKSIWNDTDRNSTYIQVEDISTVDSIIGTMVAGCLIVATFIMVMRECRL